MTGLLGLASTLVSLALAIARMVETRKTEQAAEAKILANSLKVALNDLSLAQLARRAQRDRDRSPERLHDDDGYRRD